MKIMIDLHWMYITLTLEKKGISTQDLYKKTEIILKWKVQISTNHFNLKNEFRIR